MKKNVVLMFAIAYLLTGCGYDKYEMPEDAYINVKSNNSYLVFDDIKMNDLVSDTNVEILNGDDLVVNDTIGSHTVTLNYKYNNRTYKYDITYELIDNEAPFILSATSSKTVVKDSEYDPCESANFIDNYDREPTCVIEGEYDLSTVGTYNVSYIFSDSSNNETSRNLTIKVINSEKKTTTTTTKTTTDNSSTTEVKYNIQEYINKYKFSDTMIGIDVSRWQETIDYEQVKESGVEFVIMRIGVQSGAKKDVEMDSYYEKNIQNAKDAGLKVGVYLYSTALTEEKAREHARWVVNALDGIELDFPIAYDWENWQYIREYSVSIHDLNMNFEAFASELEKYGYDAMLYSSKYYLNHIWDNRKDYPVWQAHYAEETEMDKNGILWQLTDKGRVPGISGNVDLDIYYID